MFLNIFREVCFCFLTGCVFVLVSFHFGLRDETYACCCLQKLCFCFRFFVLVCF